MKTAAALSRTISRVIPATLLAFGFAAAFGVIFWPQPPRSASENRGVVGTSTSVTLPSTAASSSSPSQRTPRVPLPAEARGIYWTAVTAQSRRADELMEFMRERKLNAVVIDIKMDNGERATDGLKTLLERLGKQGIYRIARISVMRDSAFAKVHPDIALKRDGGGYWRDKTGAFWVDPAAVAVADDALDIGREAYRLGFDEIQYDYVRYPSDGALAAIRYPVTDATASKAAMMRAFFEKVGGTLQREGIPVSFDLFGMTFWSADDFRIGQRLSDAFPFADFVSPMVYPSHYYPGFQGFRNPALFPYEVVKRTLDKGVETLQLDFALLRPEDARRKFRPWLQDFDLGAEYGPARIEAQIKAVRDAGASGWMLWNASNRYTSANYAR